MTETQQFFSDVKKILKHDRADNGGRYDGKRACGKIAALFENRNRITGDLAHSTADFWLNTYILPSADVVNEPTDAHLEKLVACNAFLAGETDGTECLTDDDWKNLQELVNYEAEDLPLDLLEKMMGILMDKGVV